VAALPGEARALLEVVAASDRPVPVDVAYRAAGLSNSRRDLLAGLHAQRLLRSAGPGGPDEIEAYHARIQDAVCLGLGEAELRERHLPPGGRVRGCRPAGTERLCEHLEKAGEAEQAAGYAVAAADQAHAALAFDQAARLYQRALGLKAWVGAAARELYRKAGEAFSNAGRSAEAGRAFLAAAEGSPPREAFELRRRASRLICISGKIEEGSQVLHALMRAVGLSPPDSRRWSVISLLFHRVLIKKFHHMPRVSCELFGPAISFGKATVFEEPSITSRNEHAVLLRDNDGKFAKGFAAAFQPRNRREEGRAAGAEHERLRRNAGCKAYVANASITSSSSAKRTCVTSQRIRNSS
jgi:tetratricopeptide (TPR) repeat protein